MKAVNVSYIKSGPWIGPDILDNTLQFVDASFADEWRCVEPLVRVARSTRTHTGQRAKAEA